MKQQPQSSTQEVLAGLVERVTFHNDENGFCVLRIKARRHRELITVIGQAAAISPGEWITASGSITRTHLRCWPETLRKVVALRLSKLAPGGPASRTTNNEDRPACVPE